LGHFVYRTIAPVALILASLGLSLLLVLGIGVRIWAACRSSLLRVFLTAELNQIHKPTLADVDNDPRVGWAQASDVTADVFTTGQCGARMPSSQIVLLQQSVILTVGDSFAVDSGEHG